MLNPANVKPIDYLIIGNITQDLTPSGPKLGGTASYSALTGKALGLRVGVITSCATDVKLPELDGIQVVVYPSEHSTTFENIYTAEGRIQYLHELAARLVPDMIPPTWRNTPIVHLGPIANEVDSALVECFPNSLVGLTLQGWLRGRDGNKRVHFQPWADANYALPKASATILSLEDVENNEARIEEFHSLSPILAVTEGARGARLFWNGDQRRFRPPEMIEVDPVGAGDIFAAAFFFRLNATKDPWEAARFATKLAAFSVSRHGLEGIPTTREVETCLVEIIQRV